MFLRILLFFKLFETVLMISSHSPTPSPTITPVVNATIRHGYLTFGSATSGGVYVGITSRSIQSVIDMYFPKPGYKSIVSDIDSLVWLNSTTNSFSYLTLIGEFIADNPIILPSQFMLVMKNASLTGSTTTLSPTLPPTHTPHTKHILS